MPSRYSLKVPLIVRDIHNLLVTELKLPTNFKSVDPELGESYGLLSPQSLNDSSGQFLRLDCLFNASSAWGSYWEANIWAISMALDLDDLLPKVSQKVDQRGILRSFDKTSSINVGRPRSPIKSTSTQRSDLWVVDVLCPCTMELMITRDPICGHS